ncbi:(2Fe-2S)-binding protein [candidate division KSB1 bacterium]
MPKSRSKESEGDGQVSRRAFLKGVSSGVVSSAVLPGIAVAHDKIGKIARPQSGVTESTVTLRVNGRTHRVRVESRKTLASVLRDDLKMTGTKVGCNNGECGACTVMLNGEPVYSCMTLAVVADGKEITTNEGLGTNGELSPVQQAFFEHDAYQCGYCTSGQIITATALIQGSDNLSQEDIKKGMSGNLCRCASYQNIFKAVEDAAGKMRR